MMISCMRCLYFIGHAAGGFFVWGSSGAGFFCFSHVLVSVFWVCLGRFDLPLSLFALPLALFDLPLALFDLPLALASAMRLAAQALPLCGAALAFFAAAKKVSKESRSHRQPLTFTHGLPASPYYSCRGTGSRPLPSAPTCVRPCPAPAAPAHDTRHFTAVVGVGAHKTAGQVPGSER
jgi:hypothetical protein